MTLVYNIFGADGSYRRTVRCPADQLAHQLQPGEAAAVHDDDYPPHWKVLSGGVVHNLPAQPDRGYVADPATRSWMLRPAA